MSKESKPRDRWRQVFAAAQDRQNFCPGCGYYFAVHAAHRADCPAELPRRDRERTRQARCDGCGDSAPLNTLAFLGCRWLCGECRREYELAPQEIR